MVTFVCVDCGGEKLVKTECGTGYAVLHDGGKVCYDCAALRDKASAARGEPLTAYVGKTLGDGMGVERHGATSRRELTTWAGVRIGTCFLGQGWCRGRWIAERMYQVYATIEGVEFTGRGQGEGMYVNLRPTAASKRKLSLGA